jgi:hypothetical protein
MPGLSAGEGGGGGVASPGGGGGSACDGSVGMVWPGGGGGGGVWPVGAVWANAVPASSSDAPKAAARSGIFIESLLGLAW